MLWHLCLRDKLFIHFWYIRGRLRHQNRQNCWLGCLCRRWIPSTSWRWTGRCSRTPGNKEINGDDNMSRGFKLFVVKFRNYVILFIYSSPLIRYLIIHPSLLRHLIILRWLLQPPQWKPMKCHQVLILIILTQRLLELVIISLWTCTLVCPLQQPSIQWTGKIHRR